MKKIYINVILLELSITMSLRIVLFFVIYCNNPINQVTALGNNQISCEPGTQILPHIIMTGFLCNDPMTVIYTLSDEKYNGNKVYTNENHDFKYLYWSDSLQSWCIGYVNGADNPLIKSNQIEYSDNEQFQSLEWKTWCSDVWTNLNLNFEHKICKECAAGKISSLPISTECTGCLSGEYSLSPLPIKCFHCGAGKYASSNNQICTICPPNSNSLEKSDNINDCLCNTGTFHNVSASDIVSTGTFCDNKLHNFNWKLDTQINEEYPVYIGRPFTSDRVEDIRYLYFLPEVSDWGISRMRRSAYPGIFTIGGSRTMGSVPTTGWFAWCKFEWIMSTISFTHSIYMCVSCVPGKYSDTTAAKSCKDCQRGKYSDTMAARSCEDCQIGKSHQKIGISNSYVCKTCKCN